MNKRCYFIGIPLRRDAISSHFQALGFELVKRGHRVVIIAPPGECEAQASVAELQVAAWLSERPTRLADARLLWNLVDQHQPDCLIAHFATVNWMCVIGWLKRVRHRIAWYHTLSTQIDGDWHAPRRRLQWLRLRKKIVYHRATHIATNSQAALEDAHRTFGVPREKCKVWRNSVADPAHWLNLCPVNRRENLILCAGRFDRTKGQDVLAEALGLCASNLGSTKIEFLGTGPLKEFVQERIRQLGLLERCTFRDAVPHDEVLRRMAVARVVIVPSRSEAFGLVNIEAMSVGTPVIASAVDGIKEIVRDGLDGVLVAPDDSNALAKQITSLLNDPSRRAEMSQYARERFLRVYEQSEVVTAQADWLEGITQVAVGRDTLTQPHDAALALDRK